MRNARRPMGRFFCLLMWLAAAAATLAAQTSGPAMTQVTDIVYRADGTAGKGTVLISWPAFTTADSKAVAAGSLSVQLGSGGTFAASLAPNTGAQPAGVYYKVVYQLSGQEPSTEYWMVPATNATTIGAVRAKLMPPTTIAAQVLTRDVAETNYVHAAGDQTLSGVKTFATSPSVPTPQNPGDAVNKGYVDAANANALTSPGPIGSSNPNTGTFTALTAKNINGVIYVGANTYATIASALAACTGPCVIDSRGHSETIASTIMWPGYPITLLLGPHTYTGPASGPMFIVNSYAANGSRIVGSGMTSANQANQGNGTTLKAAGGNTSDLIQLLSGASGVLQGLTVSDLTLDGNNSSANLLDLDAVRQSLFVRLNFQNCTQRMINSYVTSGSADQGTQFNVFDQITGGNCPQVLYADGNSMATSDFTQNTLSNWSVQFTSTSLPGIQFHQADGNQGSMIKIFPSGASYVNCLQFDTPVSGSVVGGLVNRFFGLHLGCLSAGHTINAQSGTYGNRIYGYDQIEGQAGPYGSGEIFWEGTNNAQIALSSYGMWAKLMWNNDTYLGRCAPHQLSVDTDSACDHRGDLLGNYFKANYFDTPAGGSYSLDGATVIDSSRNATVNNLTVTGTCTGCGSGGGNGGDLASPPAIGVVTPNVGTFTTLTAKSVNGTLNAAAFPGADPCAQINNAIAALPPAGGVVDASGFAASQISSGCATTINAGVAAATLRFGAGTWKLGGNPGINVTAPKVTIECPKASEGDIYNTVAATLMSNGAYPLIADTVQSFHGTDGLTVRNCYMDGNAVGTFGLFLPYGSSGHLENVYTRNFTGAGQFVLGGQWTMMAASSGANGGDGLVLGYDSAVDGNAQFAGNGGSAVHVVSGGNVLHGVGTYKNRLHGIYVDGRAVGDWTGQTAYVQQSFIRPATGNTGSFVYFTQAAGTTGSTRPSFCQVPGCTLQDGSVTWINAGTGYGYTPGSIFESSSWNFLESANSTSNGYLAPNGFDADDIRIEGTVAHPAFQNNVSAAMVRQSEANDSPAHGIHLINTNYATINNVQWLGAGYSNNPDLGGLRFEASKGNTVSDVNCWFSYSNCIQLISANNSTFSGLNVVNNGLAGTPTAGTYALSVDAGSVANTVSDLNVRDDRGPAYSRGVSDAGTQTIIGNYRKSNLAANPDSYGAGYVQEFSAASAPIYNAGSGQGYTWKSGGTQTGQLDGSGNWTVGGSLSAQSIPGHEYFVSKYASIQAAINAAYGSGVVTGKVIDDRTSAYSGAGFYIPDSVTVELAPVPYTFTGTVTHNNGNNNVAAAIVVEQGAHLAGRSTSSNHGTTIGVSAGFAGDIIATTSEGTGIGSTAQWWHWGSIENLNINGANQTSGRCLVVENMGETARVENILARSCYGNNIEIIGASAAQSSIRNITTGRSQTASGVRFTNLAGVGKVDGLSGDCNPTSLVSVQENAAGSLTILGLKAEGESSICTGNVHDPVVLLDGVSGFNDHVRIIGGYAFGTSQVNFAKFITGGNAILETEGLYITGYTNMLNDTVRSVTVPLSNNTSKQPFYYEPGGTTYANQAFTLTGGTFVQGSPAGTPTEIFGLTTGSATLLAAAGNGDNSSILTGGIQISGQNRTAFGTPPEVMARWGYRWLGAGLGYDTTNFDLVPAWNSGDSSTRSLGNALDVCKKGSTTVSCRWPNIYAQNVDTTSLTLNGSSVTIPTAGSTTPSMDGTGAAGSSANFARADHVHPSDTSRAGNGSCPANQFETGNAFGGPSCSAISAAAVPAALSNTNSVNGTAIPSSGTLTQTLCSGQVALSASGNSVASGGKYGASSSTPQTITCAGLGTTDNIIVDFASDPSGVTGFAPSANGMLTIIKYPTANTINLYVYNNTASAITPGSISVNYRVAR